MPPEQAAIHDFQPAAKASLPMMAGWLAGSHVARWWDDPQREIAAIADHIDGVSVEPLVVELDAGEDG
jgi:aminoglycoside 6'-N-acetyltransferase